MRTIRAITGLAILGMALLAFTAAGTAAPAQVPVTGSAAAQPAPVATSEVGAPDGPDCRDVAAKIQRLAHAIRGMEARLQDLLAKQDRLIQGIRQVHAELQDLQAKLDRIEQEYRQLEAEKQRLIQVIRDPNSSQADKDAAAKRIREIEAKQADLRAAAKRIHDRIGQLARLEASLMNELRHTHRQITVIRQRLADAKQLMQRMVSWYRANCP